MSTPTEPGTPAPVAPARARRGPYAKSAGRRRAIVEAAMGVFAARGYRATSMREIASAAGLSLSTLTHHFPTKEELLLATLRRRDEPTDLEAEGDAERWLRQVLRRARDNEETRGLIELYTVLCAESTTANHPGAEYFVHRFHLLRDGYTSHFRQLRGSGRLRPGVDPAVAATSLVALWDGLQLQWLLEPDEVDVPAHLAAFLALVTTPGRAGSVGA